MTPVLQYIKKTVLAAGLKFETDGRIAEGGVVVFPSRFSVPRIYGKCQRSYMYSASFYCAGTSIDDGSAFDVVANLTQELEKDQTANSIAESVSVSEWSVVQAEKSRATFTATITVVV